MLHGHPAWSSLGDDVQLRLGIRATDPTLEVNAVVHGGVSSRIAFERTINGERLGSTITSVRATGRGLPVLGADRILTLPLQDPAAPRDPNRIRLTIPGSGPAGVFPVEIELRDADSGDVLSSFVTHLVAVRPAAARDRALADPAPGGVALARRGVAVDHGRGASRRPRSRRRSRPPVASAT